MKARDGLLFAAAPRGYYLPGSFFARTSEGWGHVPEGGFPHLLGTHMELLGFVWSTRSCQGGHSVIEWFHIKQDGCDEGAIRVP